MELEQEEVKYKESSHIKEIESFQKELMKVRREITKSFIHCMISVYTTKIRLRMIWTVLFRYSMKPNTMQRKKNALVVRKERAS